MKKYLPAILFFFSVLTGFTQEKQILNLNLEQIESLFLSNNLELIATKYNIALPMQPSHRPNFGIIQVYLSVMLTYGVQNRNVMQ